MAEPAAGLPPEMAIALVNVFVSATEVEAVLVLQRAPDRRWDGTSLARAMSLTPEHATTLLTGLSERGFLERQGASFRYDPATHGLRTVCEQLERVYPAYRTASARLLFSRPAGGVEDNRVVEEPA